MTSHYDFFCEENIWQLAANLPPDKNTAACWVLLFFNQYNTIAVKNQRAFQGEAIGCWDYHVVFMDQRQQIHDFDTLLENPLPAVDYLRQTFPDQSSLPHDFRTTIRMVPANEYVQRFSSDRAHMIEVLGDTCPQLPHWPAIISSDPIHLHEYVNVQPLEKSQSRLISVDELLVELQQASFE